MVGYILKFLRWFLQKYRRVHLQKCCAFLLKLKKFCPSYFLHKYLQGLYFEIAVVLSEMFPGITAEIPVGIINFRIHIPWIFMYFYRNCTKIYCRKCLKKSLFFFFIYEFFNPELVHLGSHSLKEEITMCEGFGTGICRSQVFSVIVTCFNHHSRSKQNKISIHFSLETCKNLGKLLNELWK